MGPTSVGLLILGGVALMALIAFVAQNFENTRREKKMRVMGYKDSVRRAHHLLTGYPSAFMTPEIKKLLGTYLEQKWQSIIELEPSDDHRQQLQKIQSVKNEAIDPVPHTPGSLTIFPDPMAAKRAQGTIEEFSRFLVDIEKRNEINANVKKAYTKQLQIAHARARHDSDIFEGLQIEQMTGGEAALPKIRNAFGALESISKQYNLQTMDRQIYELRTYVDKLIELKKSNEAKRVAKLKAQYEEEQRKGQLD